MNQILLSLLISLLIPASSAAPMNAFIGLPSPFGGGGKDLSFAFLKSRDAARKKEHIQRQEQLARLQVQREEVAVRANKMQAEVRDRVEVIRDKAASLSESGAMNDEIRSLFIEREKIALSVSEVLVEIRKAIDEQEALVRKFIGTLGNDISRAEHGTIGASYSWAEFRAAKQDLADQEIKLGHLKEKRNLAARDGGRLKDQWEITNLQQKQYLVDLERKRDATAQGEEREYFATVISQQKALNEESEILEQLQKELQTLKETTQKDEYALQKYMVHELESRLPEMQERMVFQKSDITVAEQELKNQRDEASEENLVLARELRRLRIEKDTIAKRKQTLATLKVKNDASEAELEKITQELKLLSEREMLLGHRNKLVTTKVDQRKLQLLIVNIMYERANDASHKVVAENINAWLTDVAQMKKQLQALSELLDDHIQEGTMRLEEYRKYSEVINAKLQGKITSAARYMYESLLETIAHTRQVTQEVLTVNSKHAELCRAMTRDVRFVLNELTKDQRSLNIWQRSQKAVSLAQLKQAWQDVLNFSSVMYERSIVYLNPLTLTRVAMRQPMVNIFFFFFFLLFLFFFLVLLHQALGYAGRFFDRLLYVYQGQVAAIYLTIVRSFIRFFEQHERGIGIWLFVRLHILFRAEHIFVGFKPLYGPYFVALFYLCSIAYFLYLSRLLMIEIKNINQRMSFLFFTEALQEKFLFLLSSVLYASAVLLPLRNVFLHTVITESLDYDASPLPVIIYGAWTLIISLVFLFFFDKQDVLRLIPSQGRIGRFVSDLVAAYYYPVFFFVMGLLILINPYVGFSNFAMYLAVCLPASVAVMYALFRVHSFVRRSSMPIFIKEDATGEEEQTDRFDHAKLYYGAFILFSFFGALLCGFFAMTWIWNIDYTFAQLWRGLMQDWVLTIEGTGVHIGFGGLLTLSLFMLSAFIISSMFNRFVLSKLFDIFRVEAGAQNTVTRIFHYATIFLGLILGLHAIKLGQLGNWVLFGSALAISFGAKDLLSDFFAGLLILIERPIEPGNFIEAGGIKGTVKKIAIRATTIRTWSNYSVVIPNKDLVSKPIVNWGGGYYAVGFEFRVLVAYQSDPVKVRDLIAQVVAAHSLVLRIPPVIVRLEELKESGLEYLVRAFISSRRVRDQWDVAGALRTELLKVFRENNITIPYPHLVIQHKNAFGITKEDFEQAVSEEKERNESE